MHPHDGRSDGRAHASHEHEDDWGEDEWCEERPDAADCSWMHDDWDEDDESDEWDEDDESNTPDEDEPRD